MQIPEYFYVIITKDGLVQAEKHWSDIQRKVESLNHSDFLIWGCDVVEECLVPPKWVKEAGGLNKNFCLHLDDLKERCE